jgi:hypothetical protein
MSLLAVVYTKSSKLVVILWEMLDDFIFGEEHHPLYPCRFNVEVIM